MRQGTQLKEDGQQLVLFNAGSAWRDAVESLIGSLAKTQGVMTIADIRIRAVLHGVPEPHHFNAWGAVMKSAASKGYIKDTGRYVKNPLASAHDRVVKLWESLVYIGETNG